MKPIAKLNQDDHGGVHVDMLTGIAEVISLQAMEDEDPFAKL